MKTNCLANLNRPPRRVEKCESGATLVETALVFTLIAVLFFGIVAAGLLVRSYASVQNAASAGARAAAVGAHDSSADFMAMQAAKKNLSAINLSSVENFVVYKASAPKDKAPANCVASGVTNLCNVYSANDLKLNGDDFAKPVFTKDDNWTPASRLASRTKGTDLVGVSITAKCDCFTTFFGFNPTITRSATVPIEAQSF